MKFDYAIGNPPYQEQIQDTSDKPVYNYFINASHQIADVSELITPSRFLFNVGKTPKDWNKQMLNDEHFRVLHYEQTSKDVFPNTDIKGGVVITEYNNSIKREPIEVFTTLPELNEIRKKVWSSANCVSLNTIMNTAYKFKLDALYADHPEYKSVIGSNGNEKRLISNVFALLDCFRNTKESNDDILIHGLINNVRINKWIDKKYIDLNHSTYGRYKVILPASNGSGAIGEVIPTPLVGEPLVGFTQTFISVGWFDTKDEADACLKYVKTKFARTALGVKKTTQSSTPDKWQYVPIQDFTPNSDIDWSKSVADIDKQLYKKYGLSDEEIVFIEGKVKEMT